MSTQITLYLDTRRAKNGSVYPVKIRVWNSILGKAKLFPTNVNLSKKDFQGAWTSLKPRKELNETRVELDFLKSKAQKVAEGLALFTFDAFERKMYRKTGDGQNVIYHYNRTIEGFLKTDRVGSASSYDLSLKSLLNFITSKSGKTPKTLSFYDITVDFLNEYENHMVKSEKRSYTTVGIYLRNLRAVFNTAISEGEIKSDVYPFGKRKYKIPSSERVKKALSSDQLKLLFKSKPDSEEQKKAKDFWFFSYFCNGMNIKDILLLKNSDLDSEKISFYRAKTINTSKSNLKTITVYLNEYSNKTLEVYRGENSKPSDFVFPILTKDMSPIEQKRSIQNFTRFINQHLKNLCKTLELPEISTYWARHTFATNSVRNGASLEFIQESLGHGDLQTTKNYFAGFEDETKKEFAKKLMEF